MEAPDAAAWKRLGELLVQRRAQLDPRYARRTRFADERHLGQRIVYEIEKARRQNFGDGIIAAIEVAYELVPGSLERTRKGGPLEPATTPSAPLPPPAEVSISLDTVRAIVGPALVDTATSIRRHAETVLARNPHATGEDIFPGEPDLAELWDLAPSLSVPERSRYAAIMRLGRQQRKSG